jgi:hypothetical protein
MLILRVEISKIGIDLCQNEVLPIATPNTCIYKEKSVALLILPALVKAISLLSIVFEVLKFIAWHTSTIMKSK